MVTSWRALLPPLNGKQMLWLGLLLVLGYGAALAQFTFAFDYYHNQIAYAPPRPSVNMSDGRYLAELLKTLTFHAVAPSLHLAVGLSALAAAALLSLGVFASATPAAGAASPVLPAAIIVLHPFLFDAFAFESIRLQVTLGFLTAACGGALALRSVRWYLRLLAVACLETALLLYQATVNVALIMTAFATAVAILRGHSVRAALASRLVPGLSSVAGALAVYLLIQRLMPPTPRFDQFFRYPADRAELASWARAYAGATYELLFREQSIFPLAAKLALLGVLTVLLAALVRRVRRGELSTGQGCMVFAFLAGALVAAYGICLPFYPAGNYLQYRIYTPIAFATGGMVALAGTLTAGWGRRLVNAAAGVVLYVLVLNLNIAHQYLLVKNETDRTTAVQIVSRLTGDPAYRRNLPLVVVGHLPQDVAFPMARTFTTVQKSQVWQFTSFYSVYATPWSQERVMMAYLPFSYATPAQQRIAFRHAAAAGCWPSPGSVGIVEGIMVVVLDTKPSTGVSCHASKP